MTPSTPLEFTKLYKKFTEELDAASVNTLVSDKMTIIWPNGEPQTTHTRAEQLEVLSKMYAAEKAAGTQIAAIDCNISQLARDFALVKFTWKTERPNADEPTYALVSYVLRREDAGWRIVYVIELGAML